MKSIDDFLHFTDKTERCFIEGNTVDYSYVNKKEFNSLIEILISNGIKKCGNAAIYMNENSVFFPIVILLSKICNTILFLNSNSVSKICDLISLDCLITDTKLDGEVNYKVHNVCFWDRIFYIYEKCERNEEFCVSEEVSYIFMTSGTTGDPDFVFKKTSTLYKEAFVISQRLKYKKDDVILAIAPPYHAYGNAYSCFAAALAGSKVTYLNNIVTRGSIRKVLKNTKFSVMVSTPFYFDQILDFPELEDFRLRICSGGKITKKIKQSELRIHNAYGSTETGAICIELYENGGANDDVGAEYSDVQISIDENIKIESEHLMDKMISNNQFIIPASNSWKLNDVGVRDENGNIHVLGRSDNIVNIGGEKISCTEVEELISEIENIKEVKVKALEDSNNHTYLVAYIVYKDKKIITNIRKELINRVPVAKIPKEIFVRESLQRTSTGKIKENQ